MTAKLDFRKIREYDEYGQLVRAGASWNDALSQGTFDTLAGTCFTLIFFGFGGFLLPALWLLAALGVLGLVVLYTTGIKRSVIFEASGKVRAPHGTVSFHPGTILSHHDLVLSIESGPAEGYRHIVRLITNEGDTLWLGAQLQDWEALKVAVQLIKALEEVRHSAGYLPSEGGGPPGLRSTNGAELVLE